MVSVISIVGSVKSGKTFFIENLVVEMKRRKYKVAAMKHTSHSFEFDQPGKDSYLLKECGSDAGGIFSSDRIALVKDFKGEENILKLAFDYFYDMDLVLIEGYRKAKLPKILILSSTDADKEIEKFERDQITAVVGEKEISTDLNYFGKYEIKKVADFIEENFIKTRKEDEIDLVVNDKPVELNNYLKKLIGNVITGIIKSLKGVEEKIELVEIRFKKGKE